MSRERESQVGLLSGLLAVVMIVALSVMAMTALQPQREPSLREAQLQIPLPSLPTSPGTIPDAGRTRAE